MLRSADLCRRHFSTARVMSRGAFVVFEGCDRCGKTTQCKKVVQALKDEGIKAEMMVFPDRSTAIGQVISDYLMRKCELEDHAIHLLFAANRWEMMPKMKKALDSGTTLVVDRYSFSGVAFSGAKPTMSLDWCQKPESGLMSPDAVLYFTLSAEEAAKRSQFGGERYEETSFQKTVAYNYTRLQEDNWQIVDANKTIEDLHQEILGLVKSIMADSRDREVGRLWVEQMTNGDDVSSSADTLGNTQSNIFIKNNTEPSPKKRKAADMVEDQVNSHKSDP